MNHNWQRDFSFHPEDGIKKKYKCTTCGLTRTVQAEAAVYHRSGVSFFGNMPACIDWSDNSLD